jgi:hypothetical protein
MGDRRGAYRVGRSEEDLGVDERIIKSSRSVMGRHEMD